MYKIVYTNIGAEAILIKMYVCTYMIRLLTIVRLQIMLLASWSREATGRAGTVVLLASWSRKATGRVGTVV